MKIEEIRNEVIELINTNYENENDLLESLKKYTEDKLVEINKPVKKEFRWKIKHQKRKKEK